MKSFEYSIFFFLLVQILFIIPRATSAESDKQVETDQVLTKYEKMLNLSQINPEQANFPLKAKKEILLALDNGKNAVIAGFFYRDLDNNGRYDSGEELSASLLGIPKIGTDGTSG